ncbi:MAG TPA: hypothetical protein VMV94_01730 [Phycisphaerae bacterium]|nr:hypothetical protein [Phycisphaerae bacterium]
MSKAGRWIVVMGGAWLAVQAFLCWGVEALRAQTRSERAATVYQYVGVEQTIVRVEVDTGRIEILAKRGEPRASLLTRDSRRWEWQEVPVRLERHSDQGKAEPPGEPPKAASTTQEEPETPGR